MYQHAPVTTGNVTSSSDVFSKARARLDELKEKNRSMRLKLSSDFMKILIEKDSSIDPNEAAQKAVAYADALTSTLDLIEKVRDRINGEI